MAKRRKCMADGGVVDKANERVQQAVRGLAGFLNIGRPATTEVISGGRTNVPDGRQIVQADNRPDMPQERNPRRFADEVDQRKQARSGGYKDGAVPLPHDDSAIRINQQAQKIYPGGIAWFLSGVPDAIRAPTQPIGPNLAESAAPVGMSPQSQGLLTGIKDYSTTPAQLANSGRPAFVNEDGSARNMGPSAPQVMQQPIMTMKERDIAAGVDPGRAYRPGSAAGPYASGNVSRTSAPASPFATDQQYSSLQPLDTRSRRQRRQAGFADGGMVRFAGKGGPREDEIPVTVAGEHIKVSDGEAAVILPAKTAANAAALGIIGQVIKATNDGRPPKMGIDDGEEYQRGALPDEEELRRAGSPIGSPLTIFGGPAPMTAQEMYSSGPKATVTAPPNTVGNDISASGSYSPAAEGGSIKNVVPALRGIAEFAKPAVDLSPSWNALKTTGGAIRDVFADSAAAQNRGTTYADAKAQRLAMATSNEGRQPSAILTNNMQSPLNKAAATVPAQAQQAAPVASPSLAAAVQPAATTETADQTTNRGGIVTAAMGKGFDPTKLNMAQGYGMASNAAGKTLSVGPSQYIAADGSQTSRWEDTQAYKDAIARNEADKMRLAEMQSRRLGADPMAIQTARQGIASAVLGNKAKEEEMQRNDQLQSLLAKAAATTDPVQHKIALQNYLAARGINPRESDEWEIKDGGQYTVPNGMGGVQVVNKGPIAFHKQTQRWITPDGSISQGSAGGGQQQVTVGMPVNAADGDDYTYQGKKIVVKNGKVVEVK